MAPRESGVRAAPVTGVRALSMSPREVAGEFRGLIAAGARLRPAGLAAADPELLLAPRYLPHVRVDLFDTRFYLADARFEPGLNFLLAYVAPLQQERRSSGRRVRELYPRIFYKDATLMWRVASHMIRHGQSDWIGKGDVRWERAGGDEYPVTDEDSANLPYELQAALDVASRRRKPRADRRAVELVLRNAPSWRIEPYADFSAPRRRAERRTPLHGGRPVARIARPGDPGSLVFARGFEPDLGREPLEVERIVSRLYGGSVAKHRVISVNGIVQYQFAAAPRHVWINPPQALSRELTTYGVRALHVLADDAIFIPGFEYHFVDDALGPPELCTQIPAGFAGRQSDVDPLRADASAWIEALPIVREFRRRILGRTRRSRRARQGGRRAQTSHGC